MDSKKLLPIVATVMIAGIFAVLFLMEPPREYPRPTPFPPDAPTVIEPTVSYTLSDVAEHDSAGDCWLAINGKVYDVTDYISSHPGGQAILEGCGKDATTLYENRPMGSETPHSASARTELEKYLIGDLE
jgi:predicted heme/steroid binding protein